MYFVLSKVLLYIIFPLTWVFILFLVSFLSKNKRRKKVTLIAAVLLLYLFSNPVLSDEFDKHWDIPNYYVNKATPYSCAIVLGGFSGEDKDGNGRFNWAADRFVQGVKLYKEGKVSHILITSGNGSLVPGKFREATWVKTQLLQVHVPDSAILIESNSRNTIENARFSKVVLQKAHLTGPYLLVTSGFHMRRARMIFKKNGLDVIPYSCNFNTKQNGYFIDDYLIPEAGDLSNWGIYIREFVGYIVNYFNA